MAHSHWKLCITLCLFTAVACSNNDRRALQSSSNVGVNLADAVGKDKRLFPTESQPPCPGQSSGSPACSSLNGTTTGGSSESSSSSTGSAETPQPTHSIAPSPLPTDEPNWEGITNLDENRFPTELDTQTCKRILFETGARPYTAFDSCQTFAFNFYNECLCVGASVARINIQCATEGHAMNVIFMPPEPPNLETRICVVDATLPYGLGKKHLEKKCTTTYKRSYDKQKKKWISKPVEKCEMVEIIDELPNPDCNFIAANHCIKHGLKPLPPEEGGGTDEEVWVVLENEIPEELHKTCKEDEKNKPFKLETCKACCVDFWKPHILM